MKELLINNQNEIFSGIIIGLVLGLPALFYKLWQINKKNNTSLISPIWTKLWAKYHVLAVHELSKDISGNDIQTQHNDWENYIEIKDCVFWYKVIPKFLNQRLIVVISRDRKESYKSIHFNN